MEGQRCDALVQGDLAFVADLLAPDLVYVHAPGTVHSREQLLAFLRERMRYDAVERGPLALQVHGGVAWVTGLMRMSGRRLPGDEPVAAVSFVTQVWRHGEAGWKLVLLQSTKLDEALWNARPS
jgi:ketosteroid isomerase-like protein